MHPPVCSIGAQRDECVSPRFQGWGSLSARPYLLKETFEFFGLGDLKKKKKRPGSLFSAVYLIAEATRVFHREEMAMKLCC